MGDSKILFSHDKSDKNAIIERNLHALFLNNFLFRYAFSCGAFGHFVTSTTNFRELFPGIRSKLCTLTYHFFVPLFREIALGWGMMSARKSSIITALTQSNDQNAPHNADGYTSNAVSVTNKVICKFKGDCFSKRLC